ncbi:MAG: Type A flavoprotein FprA [Methanosaeta sp. PtaB.Bin039]|nr:MAG: Type A flavoprotein FprA [Methanosaeta sp. PtaB.Bin039]OPY44590.1 MAG: Type A flavoprotein FprA [Methanosaeta sp. PtaU1.Bin028]HOT06422.1 flavodoxin domain-containing protein [Methanotrichaceae archaeon]HQF16193.1 flavodoxin domain-containing protein [Methanotrichaceae archaeon]HQI90929.1 flavodoxin domain-containing protein [Methanotrichaceae archaeon]
MPKLAIIYASGMGRTKKMAETIAEGAKTVDGVEVLLKDAYDTSAEDIRDADAIMLGGSTYNYKLIKAMDPLLKQMKDMDLKGKVGMAFGSCGWSCEGIPTITKRMQAFGMRVIEPGLEIYQVPDKEGLEKCFHAGRTMAAGMKN